jgi:hypothetical protein
MQVSLLQFMFFIFAETSIFTSLSKPNYLLQSELAKLIIRTFAID